MKPIKPAAARAAAAAIPAPVRTAAARLERAAPATVRPLSHSIPGDGHLQIGGGDFGAVGAGAVLAPEPTAQPGVKLRPPALARPGVDRIHRRAVVIAEFVQQLHRRPGVAEHPGWALTVDPLRLDPRRCEAVPDMILHTPGHRA